MTKETDLKGYVKHTTIQLLNYTSGEKVTKEHLAGPADRFVVEELEGEGLDIP